MLLRYKFEIVLEKDFLSVSANGLKYELKTKKPATLPFDK